VGEETQQRPPLVPKGGKEYREYCSTGRAGSCSLVLIAGHLERMAACALRVVCGASVCVLLRHHWALNEHVHAYA
jgi:hypothetical protein